MKIPYLLLIALAWSIGCAEAPKSVEVGCGDTAAVAPAGPRFGPAPLRRDKASEIHLREASIDFGEIDQGTPQTIRFAFENRGAGTLRIWRVTCEAPLAVLRADDRIAPGSTGEIEIAVDTRIASGEIHSSAIVQCNDPSNPRAELRVGGRVIPPLSTDPPALRLSAPIGEEGALKVAIFPTRPGSFALHEVETRAKDLAILNATWSAARDRLELELRLEPDGRPHKKTAALEVSAIPAGGKKRILRLPIEVEHEDRLEILPSHRVVFSRAETLALERGARDSVEKFITIRARDRIGVPFRVTALEPSRPLAGHLATGIETVLESHEYRISIRLDRKSVVARPFAGKLTVQTDLAGASARTLTVAVE